MAVTQRLQVARQLGRGGGIDVIQAQLANTQHVVKRNRLKFALRAVTNQRHHAAAGPRHVSGGQRRHGGGSQRGGHRQFRQQQRVAGFDIGQHAECGHGQQTERGVFRMAVDVLERIHLAVTGRHQLDHAAR